jgi:hypothetical protein
VEIRIATDQDWPSIYLFYSALMAEGRTYPFPAGQNLDEANPWWMEEPPGRFHGIQFNAVVEVNEPAVHLWKSLGFDVIGTVPESFDHPDHGLVGLHLMYRRL